MIDFGWGDYDKSYIVMSFRGNWTGDDLVNMVSDLYSDLLKVDKKINFIIDLRYSGSPPMSIMGAVSNMIKRRPSNLGRVVLVSQSNIWKRLYDAFSNKRQGSNLDLVFVNSVDQAYPAILAATTS